MTNTERAQRAEAALAAYPGREEEDLAASIVDLVTDLMHLARLNDIEPDYVAHMSQDHYDAEMAEGVVGISGPCSICQSETTYASQYTQAWLCPDHGGKP